MGRFWVFVAVVVLLRVGGTASEDDNVGMKLKISLSHDDAAHKVGTVK